MHAAAIAAVARHRAAVSGQPADPRLLLGRAWACIQRQLPLGTCPRRRSMDHRDHQAARRRQRPGLPRSRPSAPMARAGGGALLVADVHRARCYYQRPEEAHRVPRAAGAGRRAGAGEEARPGLPRAGGPAGRPVAAAAPARAGHRPAGRRRRRPRGPRRHPGRPRVPAWQRDPHRSRAPPARWSATASHGHGRQRRLRAGHAAHRRRAALHRARPRPRRLGAQARAVRAARCRACRRRRTTATR